jgi:PAS domain S-box-containing protein
MAAPIGIGVTSQDGKLLVFNESLVKMGGYTADEFKLLNIKDYYTNPDDRVEIMNILEAAGVVRGYETSFLRKDNSIFNVNMSIIPIKYGAEDALLTILEDISERKLKEEAAQEERQRLARDLHDAVSQTLFSASMIAQTLERSWDSDPELVRSNLVELQILTQGALAEMRNLLFELRPAALEHTLMTELLGQLVEGFLGRSRAEIDLSISGENPLPYEVRVTFFRLGQAALSNIIKHARAGHVKVFYDSQADGTRMIIEDDGQGFNPISKSAGHHGLEIMRERASSINAELNIISELGGGTKIEVFWQNN